MDNPKIPQTDSVTELAQFWQTHELTDFEDGLEEVTETVFVREREQLWAEQITRDVKAGLLDTLLAEMDEESETGLSKPL